MTRFSMFSDITGHQVQFLLQKKNIKKRKETQVYPFSYCLFYLIAILIPYLNAQLSVIITAACYKCAILALQCWNVTGFLQIQIKPPSDSLECFEAEPLLLIKCSSMNLKCHTGTGHLNFPRAIL